MKFRITIFILFISVFSSAWATTYPEDSSERRRKGFGSVIGKDEKTGDFTLFGKKTNEFKNKNDSKKERKKTQPKKLSDYFWQAAVDSVRHLPIIASDSAGGVISTDWREDAKERNVRYKFNISIRKSDVKVNAFKQILENQRWRDDDKGVAKISKKMLDTIMLRAHALKARVK